MIKIRKLEEKDLDSMYDIFLNPESTKYWLTKCKSKEEVDFMMKVEYLSYYRRGLIHPYVIVLDDKVIGILNFNDEFE